MYKNLKVVTSWSLSILFDCFWFYLLATKDSETQLLSTIYFLEYYNLTINVSIYSILAYNS